MNTILIVAGTRHTFPPDWSAKSKPKQTHPLHGIKIRLARANEHLANIENISRTFSHSHEIVREMEPDGVHEAVKLLVAPMPETLPVIVSELVFHLRSALDNLACCLAVANGKSAARVSFPIAADRTEFEDPKMQSRIRKLPSAAQKLVRRLKPYKGGDNLLWAMNKLRNNDIHARLVCLILHGPHWKASTITTSIPPFGNSMIEIQYPHTFEDQLVLARCTAGASVEYDTKPDIDIAFSDIEFLEGERVVAKLRQMVDRTERIVQIFERHFF